MIEGEAVELTGVPQLIGRPIVSPLTGAPCIAYVAKARVYTRLDIAGIQIGDREPVAAVAESGFRELAMRTLVRGYGKHPRSCSRARS